MQEIKCPNCGSGLVEEITEEKYACLACDNVFLVHNLSKEFRQTDVHISNVHEDISRKLDNLNVGMQNVSIQANGDMAKARIILNEAEESLKRGDFLKAYEEFKKYALYIPDSYVGYEGMFRALTDSYMDDAGQYKRIPSDMTEGTVKNLLADGTDVLNKALQCEDCDKEALLGRYKEYYEKSLETLKRRMRYSSNPNDVDSLSNYEQTSDNMVEDISTSIGQCEKAIEQINSQISINSERVKFSKEEVARYNALSETEKKAIAKGKKIKAGCTFAITLILAIILWGKVGLFLHIIEVVVVLLVGLFCWLVATTKPSEYEGNESVLRQSLEQKKAELQRLQEELAEVQTEENKKKEIGIEELESFILQNNSIASSAQELYQKYSELEKPNEKTGYDVTWVEHTGFSSSIKHYDISAAGGYYCNTDHTPLPQVILTKATKHKADKLMNLAKSDKHMKLLKEISDDKIYTLLAKGDYSAYCDRYEWHIVNRSTDKNMLLDIAEDYKKDTIIV